MSVRCSLGHENPDGSAFCDECGEPLSSPQPATAAASAAPDAAAAPAAGDQICPSCGASTPAGEAFCSNCGVSLLGAPAPVDASASAAAPAPADDATPAPVAAPAAAPAGALQARLIVEADNVEFNIGGKENITLGREDAVSNIYP